MITFACSGCGKGLQAKDDWAGKQVRCPGCGQVATVHRAAATPASKGQPSSARRADVKALPPTNPGPAGQESHSDAQGQTDAGVSLPGDLTRPVPTEGPSPELTDFLAPPQAAGELGRLGGFRILKVLGHGGMGVVYQGEDPRLGRKVAIKAMLPHLAGSKSCQERFLREARAAAALEHDHIVPIFHVGEDRGAPFIVMPYLKGEALDGRLKGGAPLPSAEVLRIGAEIAEGLAAAHAQGLIHRDIKPANIWLEAPTGRVKILDFGLARVTAQESGLTQQGAILGTPSYMAPEQGSGAAVDARCDLWSLGVVLYRMCTGQLPFRGNDAVSTLLAVALNDPLPPSRLNAAVPAGLSDLVMKLLAKDPVRRSASAREVVEALRALKQAEAATALQANPPVKPSPARHQARPAAQPRATAGAPAPIRRGRQRLLLGLGAGGVAVATLALVLFWRSPHKAQIQVAADSQDIGAAALSHEPIVPAPTDPQPAGRKEPTPTKSRPIFSPPAWSSPAVPTTVPKEAAAVVAELKKHNPGFDGKVTAKVEGGVVTELTFCADEVTDLSPLQALVGLQRLSCAATPLSRRRGKLVALAPLRELKLTYLDCSYTQVADLTPLENLPLTGLLCHGTAVASVAPLRRMKSLRHLGCDDTAVSDLSPLEGLKLTYLSCQRTRVSHLAPLQGMPLKVLYCGGTQVSDLRPLRGTQLVRLAFNGTTVSDLSPLEGMPLEQLSCSGTAVSDLSPLEKLASLRVLHCQSSKVTDLSPLRMLALQEIGCDGKGEGNVEVLRALKGLTVINAHPAARFFRDLGLDAWCKQVAALPAARQVDAVAAELKDRNPGFDGRVAHEAKRRDQMLRRMSYKTEGGVVTELSLYTHELTDLSPLRALAGLKRLECGASPHPTQPGKLSDLSPLRGLKLTHLDCSMTQVADLAPLEGMKLKWLLCAGTRVSDLALLEGMPLEHLDCSMTPVSDLAPLEGMKLRELKFFNTWVTDLAPLKGMPLWVLELGDTRVSDLAPLKGMPLTYLTFGNTRVSDLAPLKGMRLSSLDCRGTPVSDFSPLKGMHLTMLICQNTRMADLSALRGLSVGMLMCEFQPERDLEALHAMNVGTINNQQAQLLLQKHEDAWHKQVATLPAAEQVEAVAAKLKVRNPGFDGQVTPKVEGGVVTELKLLADDVTDLSPLRALPGLKALRCAGSAPGKGKLADLAPLQGLELAALNCSNTQVAQLWPLKDLRLTELVCRGTRVSNLLPLKDTKLTYLDCRGTPVTDLSPLRTLPLKGITLDLRAARDAAVLRSMGTLEEINGLPAVEFWKELRDKAP